jgi:hypothetical protein
MSREPLDELIVSKDRRSRDAGQPRIPMIVHTWPRSDRPGTLQGTSPMALSAVALRLDYTVAEAPTWCARRPPILTRTIPHRNAPQYGDVNKVNAITEDSQTAGSSCLHLMCKEACSDAENVEKSPTVSIGGELTLVSWRLFTNHEIRQNAADSVPLTTPSIQQELFKWLSVWKCFHTAIRL